MADSENKLSYKRQVLHTSEAFEVVRCEWQKGSVSALHTHGWSQCAILVEEGTFENRAEFGAKTELAVYEPGQLVRTPLGVHHEIQCLSSTGKTLHVYTPKIDATENQQFRLSKVDGLELESEPTRWNQVEDLLQQIERASVSTASPFFMNQLFSGVWPETLAATQTLARCRTTMATQEAAPIFTAVETEVVDKLGEVIGWPVEQRDGVGVPGGSAANFMAVHCARHQRVPEYRARGSNGERFQVYVSKESHYSLKKACMVTGLGTDALIEVDVDASGRMNPLALKQKITEGIAAGKIPLLVVATAGTTVLGAFDPIAPLADICREFGIWLHVDAAWGGPALFSEKARPLVAGVERADSVTFDAHKLFGASLTSSFFVTRHKGLLLAANDVSGGDYIFHASETTPDRGRLSWQCGRGADALNFWAIWKNLGSRGLGEFVDRLFAVREQSVKWIQTQSGLQLLHDPAYLNICVRVKAPPGVRDAKSWSRHVRERLKEENLALVNFSSDAEGPFLRLILANPRIEFAHIRTILEHAQKVTE